MSVASPSFCKVFVSVVTRDGRHYRQGERQMAGGRLRAAEDGRLSHQSLTSPCRCQQHSPVIAPLSFFPALTPSSRFQHSGPMSNSNSRLFGYTARDPPDSPVSIFLLPFPFFPPTHTSSKFLHSPISPASLLTSTPSVYIGLPLSVFPFSSSPSH